MIYFLRINNTMLTTIRIATKPSNIIKVFVVDAKAFIELVKLVFD